jgi:hypothetical protein
MRDVQRNFAIMAGCGLSKIRLFLDSCENVIGGRHFDAFPVDRTVGRFEITYHDPHAVTWIFRDLRDDIAAQPDSRSGLEILHRNEVVAAAE